MAANVRLVRDTFQRCGGVLPPGAEKFAEMARWRQCINGQLGM